MHTYFRKYIYWTCVSVVGFVLGLSLQFVNASWSDPTAIPPGENSGSPINVDQAMQKKDGALRLDKGLILNEGVIVGPAENGLIVQSGNVGIGIVIPSAVLDIDGDQKISGDMRAGGGITIRSLANCNLKVDALGKVVCE